MRGLGGEIAVFRTRSLYLVNELVFLLDNCCTFKYLANHESGVCVICSVLSDSKKLFFKVLSLCMICVSLPLLLLPCLCVCVSVCLGAMVGTWRSEDSIQTIFTFHLFWDSLVCQASWPASFQGFSCLHLPSGNTGVIDRCCCIQLYMSAGVPNLGP